MCLSVQLSESLSVCSFISLSVFMSLYLSVRLSVCPSVSVHLSVLVGLNSILIHSPTSNPHTLTTNISLLRNQGAFLYLPQQSHVIILCNCETISSETQHLNAFHDTTHHIHITLSLQLLQPKPTTCQSNQLTLQITYTQAANQKFQLHGHVR